MVRVSTSGRPSFQRMRNGGLQNRIHLLEGHTTAWGLSQDLYKLTSRLRLGTKSLSLELRASHLSWTWNGSTTLQDSQANHNGWVMASYIGLHPSKSRWKVAGKSSKHRMIRRPYADRPVQLAVNFLDIAVGGGPHSPEGSTRPS